ncbi:hypothetical protein [Rhodobacter sp. SY28-1]|nr:hypothetical protein [Rhodobacter sp. SY28-1]
MLIIEPSPFLMNSTWQAATDLYLPEMVYRETFFGIFFGKYHEGG